MRNLLTIETFVSTRDADCFWQTPMKARGARRITTTIDIKGSLYWSCLNNHVTSVEAPHNTKDYHVQDIKLCEPQMEYLRVQIPRPCHQNKYFASC